MLILLQIGFCYERDFTLSLSENNQADVIEAFNSTPRYQDDSVNINNPYFKQIVGQIYPVNFSSFDTEAPYVHNE